MLEKVTAFARQYDMLPAAGIALAAVSGGADSMCLLAVLAALSRECGFSLAVMHFNHKLRPGEAERDARFVEDACKALSLPYHYGEATPDAYVRQAGQGPEAAARTLRYGFFRETAEKTGAVRVYTAHTADDNAETVLLNLTRGAGLSGYCGIPPVRDIYCRPLLCVTREALLAFLAERGISYVEDSTNAGDAYARNRLRHHVIPHLRGINPALPETVFRNSELLREDLRFIEGLAADFLRENLSDGGVSASALSALPRPVAARVVAALYGGALPQKQVEAALRLCAGTEGSAEIALTGTRAVREYDRFFFDASPPGEGVEIRPLSLGETRIPEAGIKITCTRIISDGRINKSLMTFQISCDSICGNIIVRGRLPGDRIAPPGRGSRTLKKLFIEMRIPERMRARLPVIADNAGVLAVCGVGMDRRGLAPPGAPALEIRCEELS